MHSIEQVHFLTVGEALVDKGKVYTPGFNEGLIVRVPIPAYLVETRGHGLVLVDTGPSEVHLEDPMYSVRGRPISQFVEPLLTREQHLPNRLAELSVKPEDISTVVLTHLHWDHAGNTLMFKHAPIYVQRAHYEFARAHRGYYNENWDHPCLDYRLVDGDLDLLPGISLLDVPGHVPGMQAVRVDLGDTGGYVLCSDAINCAENLTYDAWDSQHDPAAARDSAGRLTRLARETRSTLIFGHDPNQWPSLPLSDGNGQCGS